MKYTTEVTIDAPVERVVEFFEDPEGIKQWQPTLQGMEHISGEKGEVGSKTKLIYDERGRTMEMLETIITRDLPNEFVAIYEAKNVWNEMRNSFIPTDDGKTRWVTESDFRFSGFMKLMGIFMSGAFPKETLKSMNLFKDLVEGV